MKGKRHTTEEKIRALREADGGKPIREVCQERNISEATYHRWRKQFGMMEVDEAIRQALKARFGSVPAGVDEILEGISEPETLRSWLRLAVTAATPEDFQEAIRGEVPPPPRGER